MTNRPLPSLIVGLLLVACGTPQLTDPELATPGISSSFTDLSGSGSCGGSGNHALQNGVDGTCNGSSPVVNLTDVGGGDGGTKALKDAIAIWNERLDEAGHFNVPTFAWASSGGIPVYFSSSTATIGTDFCGLTPLTTTGSAVAIYTYKGATAACLNFQRGTLTQVLVHELSHVLGLNSQHGGVAAQTSLLTGGGRCASYITPGSGDGSLSNTVCHHEVETIIRARNGTGYVYDQTLYTSSLAFGTNVTPRETSIDAGSAASFTVSSWSLKPSGSVARTATSVTWTPVIPGRVSIPSDGVVKGESAGVGRPATTVRLTGRAGSLPAGHQFWTPFRDRGDSVKVTVTAPVPPPPQPFKVDSIWSANSPITTPGWNTIFASVASAPGTPVAIRWIVIDSRTPSVADTLYTYGLQMDVFASAGSYTIAFRARPQYGSTFGIEYFQDIPVCTGDALLGGAEEQASSKKQGGSAGGPGQDAVGGC